MQRKRFATAAFWEHGHGTGCGPFMLTKLFQSPQNCVFCLVIKELNEIFCDNEKCEKTQDGLIQACCRDPTIITLDINDLKNKMTN